MAIVRFDLEDKHNEVRTDGCSCCSVEYSLSSEKDKILWQLKDNLEMLDAVLGHYKISLGKFRKMIENGELVDPYKDMK